MSTVKDNVGLSNPQERNVDVGTLYVTFLIAQAKLEILTDVEKRILTLLLQIPCT